MSALFAVSCYFYSLQGHRPWLSKGASNLLYTDLPSIQAAPWGELPPTVPLVTAPPHTLQDSAAATVLWAQLLGLCANWC